MATTGGIPAFLAGVQRMLRGGRRSEPAAPASTPHVRGVSTATVEVDPRRVGAVHLTYSPTTDGDPDPGEIVWTWVPYEENDGRGKDRPVVIVASEPSGTVL